MKIGINALFLIPNKVGGTEYLLRSFIKYLELHDKHNEYIVFCNEENYKTFNFSNKKWSKKLCAVQAQNRPARLLYEQIILPLKVKKENCKLLHSFGYFGPVIPLTKHIVTIHDVNWRDHSEDISLIERLVLKLLIEFNIITASKIVTDSDFSQRRLKYYFPKFEHKFIVVKAGIEDDFIRIAKQDLRNPLTGKQYILCVSAMYPHKNILYLLDLWEQIWLKNKKLYLVLIGQNGRDSKKVKDKTGRLNNVIYIPKVSWLKLISYYKFAKVFVLPSNYEGFGFPVYEAAQFNVPIFVSAPKMYDNSINRSLRKLTFNPVLDARNIIDSIGKVKKYSTKLSYEKSTSKLLKVYEAA